MHCNKCTTPTVDGEGHPCLCNACGNIQFTIQVVKKVLEYKELDDATRLLWVKQTILHRIVHLQGYILEGGAVSQVSAVESVIAARKL